MLQLGRHHLLLVRGPPGLGSSLVAPFLGGSKVDDVDDAYRLVAVFFLILTLSSVDIIGLLDVLF